LVNEKVTKLEKENELLRGRLDRIEREGRRRSRR
jgi:hypothetical protein